MLTAASLMAVCSRGARLALLFLHGHGTLYTTHGAAASRYKPRPATECLVLLLSLLLL